MIQRRQAGEQQGVEGAIAVAAWAFGQLADDGRQRRRRLGPAAGEQAGDEQGKLDGRLVGGGGQRLQAVGRLGEAVAAQGGAFGQRPVVAEHGEEGVGVVDQLARRQAVLGCVRRCHGVPASLLAVRQVSVVPRAG